MTCHKGGFLTILHDYICDITVSLLTEVWNSAATEPQLQERITGHFANTDDGAWFALFWLAN